MAHCPLYHVPKCRYTMCLHFLFTSSFKGLLSCHLLVSMSLLVNSYVATKAKHKTEHEHDVWRTCASECFATRIRWRCTCSTTSRILIKWYRDQGTDPISHKISYHKISQSLESARSDVESLVPLWNLTSVSVAVLLRRLPYFRPIGKF